MSPNSLNALLRNKKVEKAENKEIVMNDFDLDANEIMSWLRGDTDHLDLHLTPKKEKKPEGEKKVNYTIQVEKSSVNVSGHEARLSPSGSGMAKT